MSHDEIEYVAEDDVPDEYYSWQLRPPPRNVEWGLSRTVLGPKDDPYMRIAYEAKTVDHSARLTVCALAGVKLEIDGTEVVPFGMVTDRWLEENGTDIPELWFEAVTGVSISEIEEWQAESEEFDSEVRAAERAAGWDPSP